MQQKVKFPAIGLIVLGILGILSGVYSIFAGAVDVQQLVDAGMPIERAEQVQKFLGGGGMMLTAFSIAVSAFVTWAGFQMLNLRSWTAAVVANVLVMIPCVSSCCCVFGIPIGAWGLITLFNADVKRAFQGQGTPPPI